MSLINQTLFVDGVYKRLIDSYSSTYSPTSTSNILGSADVATRIASSSSNVITILRSGWYRISFNSYVKFSIPSSFSGATTTFKISAGTNTISSLFSSTTLVNTNFSYQQYYQKGGTALSGTSISGGSSGGLTGDGMLSSTGICYLSSGETVKVVLIRNSPSGSIGTMGVSGEITIEAVS